MALLGLIVVSLICAFIMLWGFSISTASTLVEKGTRERIILETAAILLISLGMFISGLYVWWAF